MSQAVINRRSRLLVPRLKVVASVVHEGEEAVAGGKHPIIELPTFSLVEATSARLNLDDAKSSRTVSSVGDPASGGPQQR